jgi:hypothetical protein
MSSSRTYVVDQNSPAADDGNDGSPSAPLKTISAAAALAGPGETVRVAPGVYRERVSPARGGLPDAPVTYEAIEPGRAVIKASDLYSGSWESIAPGVWRTVLPQAMFTDLLPTGKPGYNPFAVEATRLPGRKTLGQVICDGDLLVEADTLDTVQATPGTWRVGDDGLTLTVHLPGGSPDAHVIEISCRMRCFAPHERGLGYVVVRGLVMEHAANQFPSGFYNRPPNNCHPQAGMLSTRSGHHWTIERNTLRLASAVAIDCGNEGRRDIEGDRASLEYDEVGWHTIRHNVITDCGACGIIGAGASDSVISYNRIERINRRNWTAPETGGVKLHFCDRTILEGNLVRDCDCFGIWLDNRYTDARITRNSVINCQKEGIFMELGEGPALVDNNVVAYTRCGAGIYCHDASGLTIAHNLCYGNGHFGIYLRTVTDRCPTGTSNNRVLNNVLIDNYRGHICMPIDDEISSNNHSDWNLLINGVHPHWEGLGSHKFCLNNNDGLTDMARLVEHVSRAAADLPAGERPDMDYWPKLRYLTFELWKRATGWDANSVAPVVAKEQRIDGAVAEGAVNFSSRTPSVDFMTGALMTRMSCPAVESVDLDFVGRPFDGDRVLPGPFQDVKEAHTQFVLFPIPEVERD